MTPSDGICQINAIDIGELTIEKAHSAQFGGATMVAASAKYALIVKSGERVGAGTCTSWSETTKERLRNLLESMEADICTAVFGKAPPPVEGTPQETPHSDGVPGL